MPRDDSRPGLEGTRVGDYQVLDLIGRGGMAEVYRARDERLGRVVALKILAPHLAYDERFRLRFVRESRTVAGMDHPYIIPIFEAGEADGLLFIAMRYVAGRDLRALLIQQGTLPPDRTIRMLGMVAAALDAAHETGLVHRDVKPANVLISGGGGESGEHPEHVYLTDFGLTKNTEAMSGLTSQGQFVGTPRYIAPEQITGDPVDGRCDQYALACVAYEMLAGAAPFQRDSQLGLLYAHVSDEAPPLTAHRPDLPAAVNTVLSRALSKTSTARYATCLEFVMALREAFGEPISDPRLRPYPAATSAPHPQPWRRADTVPPSSPRLPPPPVRARRRRPPLRLIGAGVAVLAALVAGSILFLQGGGTARYPGSAAAPFAFTYPAGWDVRTHSDLFVLASSSAGRFEELFKTPVSADWTGVEKLDDAEGVFAGVSDTLNSSATADRSLQYLLPGTVTLGGSTTTTAAGRTAMRYQGTVADPQQRSRLDLTALVVPRPGKPAAYVIYFCAPAACDSSVSAELESSLAFTD